MMRSSLALIAFGSVLWPAFATAQWNDASRSGLPSVGYREPDWKSKSPNDTALTFSCLNSDRIGLFFRLRYEARARQGKPAPLILIRSDGQTLTLSGVWSMTSARLGTNWMMEVPHDARTISFMTAGDAIEVRTPYHSERVPLEGAAPLFNELRPRCVEYVRSRRTQPDLPSEIPIGPRPPRGRNAFD